MSAQETYTLPNRFDGNGQPFTISQDFAEQVYKVITELVGDMDAIEVFMKHIQDPYWQLNSAWETFDGLDWLRDEHGQISTQVTSDIRRVVSAIARWDDQRGEFGVLPPAHVARHMNGPEAA